MMTDLFARAFARVDAELDWEALGARVYCSQGGEDFFVPERRDAMHESGLAFAADLAERLPRGGRSAYVGAGVAELAPILFESVMLERQVAWLTLPGLELELLELALTRVSDELGVELPRPAAGALEALPRAVHDHVWLVSVLTDPDAFPCLHDELYRRAGTAEAVLPRGTDVTRLRAREDERARALARSLVLCATTGALVSTTEEEAPYLDRAASDLGGRIHWPARGRVSGLVGDVVRHGRLDRPNPFGPVGTPPGAAAKPGNEAHSAP